MRTLFVTGGAGFIGSAFVRLLTSESEDLRVVNYDALTYAGNLENLADVDGTRHTFVRGDICDAQTSLGRVAGRMRRHL